MSKGAALATGAFALWLAAAIIAPDGGAEPAADRTSVTGAGVATPPRPADCEDVAAGSPLGQRIAELSDGAVLCLEPGIHPGPLRLDRAITLWGKRDAVIRSAGNGSTIEVVAPGVTLAGFRVDGSGGRFDLLDAAIRINADDVRVEGVEIRDALFGILVERSRGTILRGNRVVGNAAKALGMRGDGIRLWEVRGARIEENRLVDSRDLVVWYSANNTFLRNEIRGGRYGTHFMYSHDNRVEANRYVANVVGIFAMYSRGLSIRANVIADSGGAAGVGLGAKESGNLIVEGNWLVANTVGIYLDTSPLHPDERNRFSGNAIRFGEVGVVFHGRAERNRFESNRFADHHVPVRVEGRGSARDAVWHGNDFDDYAGYDLDGDGIGDLPYVLRNLEADLAIHAPSIRYFRGTPAMTLVEWIGRAVPLFQPTILLEDPAPAMRIDPPALAAGSFGAADAG